MRRVKVFRTKKDIRAIDALLSHIQMTNDNNRVMSVQIDGKYAYVTAAVEIDGF